MDQPPPPSYDEVVKRGPDQSAPSAPQGYHHHPQGPTAPPQGAPYPGAPPPPQGQPAPYGQSAYPPSTQHQSPAQNPGQTGYSAQPPVQGGGGGGSGGSGFPQYTYAPVQAGLSPAGGYQYSSGQQNVTVTAGYQTTPLAYGRGNTSSSSVQNRKVVFIICCFFMVFVLIVIPMVITFAVLKV